MKELPEIIAADNVDSSSRLEELKRQCTFLHDELDSQVSEMLKARYPSKKLKGESLSQAVQEFFQENNRETYGNWVYYPWSKRLVRVLPEADFIFTRLSPNNPKIRPEEQAVLRKKKVGVVGLSVGQSISLVLAMERICGELRIADFDVLELANLNRIRAGVHSMGLNKTEVVAREIWEIDPYFKITCFEEGLLEENMDDFFHAGGDLDLVVDECDSVDIKMALRKKAKSMRIPVVMDMSDRGTIDIERFDLEPDRPPMHGWLEHLDYSNMGALTNEQKVPFMMPIFGIDTISKRLKASMVEIGESIHTWPQLATAVAMGGALAADTVRRIFLNQFEASGRYHIDLDQLISDHKVRLKPEDPVDYNWPELETEEMLILAKSNHESVKAEAAIDEAMAEALVQLAGLAPSAGNNQPWKWLLNEGKLYLFHDKARSYSWTDHDDKMALIGLGAAEEAMQLAANRHGLMAHLTTFEKHVRPLIAGFGFSQGAQLDKLEPGIELRCANRKHGELVAVDDAIRHSINDSIPPLEDIQVHWFDDRDEIREMASIIARAEKVRFLNPQGHYEFFQKEMRWTPEEVKSTKDGLDVETLELKASDYTGLEVASDPYVIALLNRWKGGKNLEKMTREACINSSALVMLTIKDLSEVSILNGGRGVMRAWTAANMSGWNVHPVSAPLFFANRIEQVEHGLKEHEIEEIKALKQELITLAPILKERKGLFLFRLAKGNPPSKLALRRDMNDILVCR